MLSEELRLVNAFFGFCVQSPGWPSPLAALGYRPCGVEREIRVSLDGTDRTVVPDFICATAVVNHALCIEAKSRTVHEDQARRYVAVRPLSLLNTGNLPPAIDPSELTFDVAYATARRHAVAVATQLATYGVPFPVVGSDERTFGIESGTFNQPDLNELFQRTIDITEAAWPTHYVPFNSESPSADMVPFVARAMSEFIIKGIDFSGDDIAAGSTPHWPQCGTRERQRIRDGLVALVNDATANELNAYIVRQGTTRAWRVIQRPSGYHGLNRFRRLVSAFLDRAIRGQAPAPSVMQIEMFPEVPTTNVLDEEYVELERDELDVQEAEA